MASSTPSTSSFTCQLCPGGASPIYPNAVLTVGSTQYTCHQLVSIAAALQSAQDCWVVQSGAFGVCCDPTRQWTCDPYNDPCPNKADGLCMNYMSPVDPTEACVLETADCIDCDICSGLSYMGCDVCTSLGCHWCPGDGLCSSIPFDKPYYPPPLVTVPSRSCVTSSGGGTGQDSTSSSSPAWLTSCPANDDTAEPQQFPIQPVFNDVMYIDNAWAFRLINVEPVWRSGITGTGVRIRINDEGVDATAMELTPNFDVNGSCVEYLPSSNADRHGTACASVAAATANNNECSVGIAPNATISSCKVFGTGIVEQKPDLLLHALDRQDVSSNSFGVQGCASLFVEEGEEAAGENQRNRHRRKMQTTTAATCPFLPGPDFPPCSLCRDDDLVALDEAATTPMSDGCAAAVVEYCSDPLTYEMDSEACVEHLERFTTCHYNGLAPSYQRVFTQATRQGRDGKGLVLVFASGNEYATGSDANMDGVLSSRFTIAVGAVDKGGRHSAYSTPGACLLVSAPGGDIEHASNWVTAQPGGTCGDSAFGTSLAAPVVSGVVALMLEANPRLGWRDVQGILAQTSQSVLDPSDDSWVTNSAGLSHSYLYGFGIIDAAAAVGAAKTWTNYGPEQMVSASSGPVNRTIDDVGTPVNSTLSVNRNIMIESVVVYLDVETSSRGHLHVRLISPSGVESILAPGMRPSSARVPSAARWKLSTVRNWGEASKGIWTLVVADTKPGDYLSDSATSDCVDVPYDDDTYYYFVQDCVAIQRTLGQSACDDMPKARDACCFCGGGEAASALRDQLRSWTIVLYGHNRNDGLGTVAPSSLLDGDDSTIAPSPPLDLDTVAPSPLLDGDDSTNAPSPPFDDDDSTTIVSTIQPTSEEAVVEMVPTRKPISIPVNPDAVQGEEGSLSSTSSSSSYSSRVSLVTAYATWTSLWCGSAIVPMILSLFE
jgi:Subtilase family/Proprotein convertase P-domain